MSIVPYNIFACVLFMLVFIFSKKGTQIEYLRDETFKLIGASCRMHPNLRIQRYLPNTFQCGNYQLIYHREDLF